MDKEIQEFCRKYDAVAGPSHKVHHRVRRLDYKIWSESDPKIIDSVPYEDIPCVEIHMPEDRFRALVEHDHWLELNQRRHNGFEGAEAVRMAREHERECCLRNQHASLQKAWEQYRLILRLVDSNE